MLESHRGMMPTFFFPTARHSATGRSARIQARASTAIQLFETPTNNFCQRTASMSKPDDEIVWSSQLDLAQEGGWLHQNNILFYFARSPFFDRTSNNAVIFSQAMTNPQMWPYIQNRETFEARLKSMSGLEYVVVDSPALMGEEGTGVWTIRKQTRRKVPGEEDEVTVHQSYFVVGPNIYQSPNLADVLTAKMVSADGGQMGSKGDDTDNRRWPCPIR